MPAKKDSFWETKLKSVRANNPTWGAGRIRRALEQIAAKEGRDDAPKNRWVGEKLRRLTGDPSWPQEEREYRALYWPESFIRGDLPWEAGAAAFDLLRAGIQDYMASLSPTFITLDRPDVRLAKWFWRVTQAIPYPPEYLSPSNYQHVLKTLAHSLREWEIGVQSDELARAVEEAIATLRQRPSTRARGTRTTAVGLPILRQWWRTGRLLATIPGEEEG